MPPHQIPPSPLHPLPPLLLLLLLCMAGCTSTYRPVIIMHGLLDGPKQLQKLSTFIQKEHPGTEVTLIDRYDYLSSLDAVWKQVRGIQELLEPIMQRAQDGVHLLCFSQGGLICRALLSTIPNHNVHTFISLSSPQAGQYGDTEYLRKVFPDVMKEEVFHVCYKRVGQIVSICNYWNDPHHRSRYLQNSNFLPLLNGEKLHNDSKAWRESFLRIRKLVLIGGPDDGVITPWQSSLFGFYDQNENMVEMGNQEFYRNDVFGLQTLVARGDVSTCIHAGVKHIFWHSNLTVFKSCVEKWLT